jgi:hypothetical protein
MRFCGVALVFAVLSAVLSACGGSTASSGDGNAQPSGGVAGTANTSTGGAASAAGGSGNAGGQGDGGGCQQTATSTLTGASIRFLPPLRCVYTLAEAAAGISIGYELVIAQDIPDVVPQAQATCVLPGASGLYVLELVTGNGQNYCLCDNGLCVAPPSDPTTLRAGTYAATFLWDGMNWYGPSDTGNPKGPPFPAGSYVLEVSAQGTRAGAGFEVQDSLPLTLVP